MSDIDPATRQLLLVMGVSSAVAKAFLAAAREKGWPEPDPTRTDEAFSVIGPLMLSGLPEREVVERLEEPYPLLYLDALSFCQSRELDGQIAAKGAARLPFWALKHIHGRLPSRPEDGDFLDLIQRYLGTAELKQMVAQMKSRPNP